MKTFLETVAKDLYDKLQGDFSRTAVIFPNKRAGLFFNEYLAKEATHPIWSPAYLTISEMFRSLTDTRLADPIELVCLLYKVFRKHTGSNETLDEFYFWGELLISDFDDIDKNMVDAQRLFSNLQDLKSYNDFDFLNEEQEEAIREFFQNFSISRITELKQRFISLWNVLGNIYNDFRQILEEKNEAYEGMLHREACQKLIPDNMPYERYVFVGFNVLNKVEHRLFKTLQDSGKAMFYWDYDINYLNTANHEAGEFIRRNLNDFPSELSAEHFNNFDKPKHIEYISASTENAQARQLPEWLRNHLGEKELETAVVLCNEALLQPVIHSLPDNIVKHVNITMGFPLTQTPAYSFVKDLINLQSEGYDRDKGRYHYAQVSAILKHPYVQTLSEEAKKLNKELTENNRFYPLPSELQRDGFLTILFHPVSNNSELCNYLKTALQKVTDIYKDEENSEAFNQLYRESLFKTYVTMNRFYSLIEDGELLVQTGTLARLIEKVLSTTSIPFHGEPAIGLQVMGVLETRNLDFRNIAILSLNEGKLPKSSGDSSFIPYNLRKAFGMTLIEHKNAVYAYYFYRMIQRAENIALLYNNSSDGLNRGEMSRFMLQMLTESKHEIQKFSVTAGQAPMTSEEICIAKTAAVKEKLHKQFFGKDKIISPSAINTYLDCPLKFYFHYVAGLRPKDEVSTEIDSAMFGSIFHRTAELIYKDLTANRNIIQETDIERLLKNKPLIENYVDSAFKELFFKVKQDELPEYNGIQLLNSEVIVNYIRQLLEKDKVYTPFHLVGMEEKVYEDFNLTIENDSSHTIRIGGIIDRLDSKDGILRIVDYKTGGEPSGAADLQTLFTQAEKRPGYILQTFLYAAILTHRQNMPVAPSLLYIHKAASATYSPVISIGKGRDKKEVLNFKEYDAEFRHLLKNLLEEIFNPEIPFAQTEFKSHCAYCDFKELCRQ